MRRAILTVCVFVVAAAMISGQCLANGAVEPGTPAIVISPNVLVLGGDGTWVTVHSNIPYGTVNTATLALNGISCTVAKADSRGQLVAKFRIAAIKAIVAPPQATLTLTGAFKDGTSLVASDTIAVR